VGRVGWLHRFDVAVTGAFHTFAGTHSGWVRAMSWWSIVFAPTAWRLGALLLAIWLIRRRAWPLAVWVAVTVAMGDVLGLSLKVLVGRHRPSLLDPVARAPGFAFPSGHALDSALGATVFLLVLLPLVRARPGARKLLWLAAIVVPLVTGISRIALGVHWTSDVVAGWLLGVAVPAVTAWAYLRWRGRPRADVTTDGLQPDIVE